MIASMTAAVTMEVGLRSKFILLFQTFYVYDGVLYYYSSNPYYPRSLTTVYLGAALFSFFVLFSISFTVIQFLYRYGLVVRTKPYSKKFIFGTTTFILLYIIGHHALFWVTFRPPNSEYDDILRVHGENLSLYIVADLRSLNSVWFHFIHFQLVVIVAYSINIYLGTQIWRHLKTQSKKMSTKTFDLQKQITKVLVIQVILVIVLQLIFFNILFRQFVLW